jgi:peptidyl-prolyl cis-trans isomerase A (cyclophilin A)
MKRLTTLLFCFLTVGLFAQDLGEGMYAKIETDKGDIIIQLEYEKVPLTVSSFVALAEGKLKYDTVVVKEPFFDSLKFHRVIDNFMVQGGDPLGNGTGGPGYRFPDEIDSSLTHSGPGILSMANSGPNTNGSQFFITHKATPWLDGKHAVFGHVIVGQEVVDKIAQDDIIKAVKIIRIGDDAEKFKAGKYFKKSLKTMDKEEAKKAKTRNATFFKEMAEQFPKAKKTASGLMYVTIEEGDGTHPVSGTEVEVHYTGTFLDGKKFDSSKDRNKTFKFKVDESRVIQGWHEGLKYAENGGKIKLILPYWLAYGKQGRASIPPKATLIFDIELISMK